jgi:hypothetical protein
MIETAVAVLRSCAEEDDEQHDYIPQGETIQDFIPHSWAVAAVCIAMKESYRQGYADRHNKGN